ncbi:MAG: hypothetical protein QW292_09105 [Candidatus Parvarchaeota archaeon]
MEKDEKELGIEDQVILLNDEVNYAIEEIKKIKETLSAQGKDIAQLFDKIVHLGEDLTELNNNVASFQIEFDRTDDQIRNEQARQRLGISEIKTEISSLRELVDALFDALNVLVNSINAKRNKNENTDQGSD